MTADTITIRRPTVCALVPAHNEEDTIAWCLEWIRDSDYPVDRVIVVADACSPHDKTARIARAYGAEVVETSHQDKAAAQNEVLFGITEDIIVGFDGDTAPAPDCIRLMVEDLGRERLNMWGAAYTWDATCSTILPAQGDAVDLTGKTKLKRLEGAFFTGSRRFAYALGARWWRAAQAQVGRIQVLTGACYAFRTEAIQGIGGFPNGLITADMDATWTLHGAGYKCGYTAKAMAYTMDPEDFRTYRSQMRRWSSGYFQNMARHRSQLLNWRAALVVGGAILDMVMLFFAESVILWAAILGNHPAVVDAFALWTLVHVVVCTALVSSVVGPRQALAAVGPYLVVNYYNKWLYLCGMCREWILGRRYSAWTGRQGRATVITPMTTRRRIILANVAAALGVPLLLMGAWQAAPLLASAGVLAALAAWSATFPWRGRGRRRDGSNET